MVYRNIKAEMARNSITMEDLAAKLGVSVATVSNKITGKREWSLGEAAAVVEIFNGMGGEHSIESLFETRQKVLA